MLHQTDPGASGVTDNIFARLVATGYSPVPIIPGEKRPGYRESSGKVRGARDWTKYCERAATNIEARIWAERSAGVGIACGYNCVIALDIDSDDPAVLAAIEGVVPRSPVRKRGRRGYTAFYRGDVTKIGKTKIGLDNGDGVDILARGSQTVIPPSIHPTEGVGAYQWLEADTLEHVTPDNLPKLPDDIAAILSAALTPFGAEEYAEGPHDSATAGGASNCVWREVNDEALLRPGDWVPHLGQEYRRDGARWCIQALWRGGAGFNVKIHKRGIKDFAAKGDKERYSPVDLVMVAMGTTNGEALDWLKARLGIEEPDLTHFEFRYSHDAEGAHQEQAEAEDAEEAEEPEKPEKPEKKSKKSDRRLNPRRFRPNDRLPTIQLTEGNIEAIVSASEAALIKAERGVYLRNGRVVSAG